MYEDIVVSVVCNAYNHEEYIKDTIESFISQKTNFKFEILVHDDASTDKTASIIKKYSEKYTNLIKPIYQTENKYSKGIHIGPTYQFPRAKGKYIAICEGDDYWIDDMKLQKQVDAMEKHPEIDICAHSSIGVNAQTKDIIYTKMPACQDKIFTIEEVIVGGGGFVETNSLLFRKELLNYVPEFRKYLCIDYTLQIYGALKGGMLFLKDIMSAYRVFSKNSWTSLKKNDMEFCKKNFGQIYNMLNILNIETDYKFAEAIYKRGIIECYEYYNYLTEYNSCKIDLKKLTIPDL